MRKKVKLLLSLLVIVATFTLGFEVPVHAAKVKLSKKSVTLEVGKKKTIKVKGTTKKVTWSSSDKNIATVSSKGEITAKGEGTCKITAKVGSKKLTCKVTVKLTTEAVKNYTKENEEEGREPQNPEQSIEDGYWHEDTPSVTATDLQAAAESDLAVFSSYLSNNDWSIIDTSVTRATDTQYGIFVHFGNGAGGESWRMVKAETPDGRGIAVGWYQSYGGSPFDISTNYDDYTNGPYGATDFSLD